MAGSATDGSLLVHGTCIALSDRSALLRGAPGSGKSDLALRFISRFGGAGDRLDRAQLVSDDQVLLSREGDVLIARPPETIAGKLEVRGLGVIDMIHCEGAPLVAIVDLVNAQDIPRLPPDPPPHEEMLGVAVPVLKLNPFELSSTVKLKLMMTGEP